MMTWTQSRQPRPNVRLSSLEPHALPQRLRGDLEDDDYHPEAIIAWLFVAFVIGGVIGMIILRTA